MGGASSFGRVLQRASAPAAALYRLLLLALAVWVCWRGIGAVWPFTIDDAGISYAYAKHIAAGDGPVAALGGPWVEGYSNALWVFLLVPFEWLGLPLPQVAKVLGALLFAASVAVGAGLLALNDERRWHSFGALDVALAIAMAGCLELVVWVVAGLENSLFAFLTLLLAWLDARESKAPGRRGSSGLAAFALCITRPEGAMYAAPVFAIKLVQALRKREPWRQVITGATLCFAPLIVYHVIHYLVFGELVPNTYYAKPGSRDWARGYGYLKSNLEQTGLLYLLPLALLSFARKPRLQLLLGWHCVAGAAFILYSGGDWMPHGRFLSLFMPALFVLAAIGVGNLARALVWLARGRLPRELVLVGLAGALLAPWWGYQAPRLRKVAARPWCHFCEVVADTHAIRKLSQRAGLSSYSLATHDFGGPAWLSDAQFYPLDFLGLCDPSVARIRHDRVRRGLGGSSGHEFRLYQYVLHEQPAPPSWLYVPPNFWATFDLSPEFRGDYFQLAPRALPHARPDAVFGLHRGELVDYFPPVQSAEFRPLTPGLTLVGSALALDQSRLHALLSVVQRGAKRRHEQLKLRLDAGAESVESEPLPLFRGLDAVEGQLEPGEPLSVELSLALPVSGAAPYRVSLGVWQAAGKSRSPGTGGWSFTELGTVEPGALLGPPTRGLPRYPAALPPPLDAELRQLRAPVTQLIERRRHEGNVAINDAPLGERLIDLGVGLEERGQPEQAYLAYVWATQVDRRAWEELVDDVFRLRRTAMDDAHVTELMLLEQYYASGAAASLARLVAFYLAEARPLEADYFIHHLPAAAAAEPPWPTLAAALAEQLRANDAPTPEQAASILGTVAQEPLGAASDFEHSALDGWHGETQAFSAGPPAPQDDLHGLRGQHGRGVLSSARGGVGARGSLVSPEFELRGSMLSLLVGGGSRRKKVGVELVVAGQVVKSAHGNDSAFMYPELWNVAEHVGKKAQLRIYDQSPRSYVLLDRVLSWR